LYDQTNGNSEIPTWLTKKSNLPGFQFWRGAFKGNFADWKNKVHEVLTGFKAYAPLPAEEKLALYHPKTIDRQEIQNKYYESLIN